MEVAQLSEHLMVDHYIALYPPRVSGFYQCVLVALPFTQITLSAIRIDGV
jgi:hypothetical protein